MKNELTTQEREKLAGMIDARIQVLSEALHEAANKGIWKAIRQQIKANENLLRKIKPKEKKYVKISHPVVTEVDLKSSITHLCAIDVKIELQCGDDTFDFNKIQKAVKDQWGSLKVEEK